MNEIYKNIKQKRYEMGWTQTDLAEKVGYSNKSMIARVEAGTIDIPQSKIAKFAEVFGCTPSELMGSTEVKEDILIEISHNLKEDALERLLAYAKDLYSVDKNRKE